ncbi:unnamed protein product [Periconia digitata]|uniref:Uncharacterized protein n=1 Tax=Periconia digitata TaxID=1303443 RepID=A0A9W4U2T2_9PLEO|nr:unnamed protein product [Periconia digitata]
MGRRPNPLILEYFSRGPKLQDASNRYQHTCKSCGEKFPKGRSDSLYNHLIKKCPALPLRDRQRALLQQHDFPELPLPDLPLPPNASTHSGQSVSLPFAPSKQGLSALETLAEVSRRHLDLSDKRTPARQARHQHPLQPLVHETANHDFEFLVDDRPDDDTSALSQSLDVSNVPALPSVYQFNGPLQHSPIDSQHMGVIALAANELMPLAHGGLPLESELNLPVSEKFFHTQPRHWANSIDPLLPDQEPKEHSGLHNDMGSKLPPMPRPIAMNNPQTQTHFTTDFSVNQKPPKPKVRGRFSDSRRKEVQEVRKRGACIRCRMLKKPCSGDNPCSTCQNVESARLWKQPCIRTRIAEEFNLYSAGLHAVLAFHAVSQAKNQIRLDQTPGRIEITHHPESGVYATFASVKCQSHAQGSEIDPVVLTSNLPPELEIIDGDEDIAGKLDLYIKQIGNSLLELHSSDFMKATIQAALSIQTQGQDGLLMKVLELWNLTCILTSTTNEWLFFSNPSLAPSTGPSVMTPSDLETINRSPITSSEHGASYDLIKLQLMGATEKRASCLSRTVMNDLERRLLQRQQANPFETFLVAVILLVCVERMCWLFRSWEDQTRDNRDGDNAHSHEHSNQHSVEGDIAQVLQSIPTTQNAQPSSSQYHHPKWPFDKHPSFYSQQGERFSDILLMLLKMRSVPPKPHPRDTDGMLLMWGHEVDDKIRDWYENIGVTGGWLAECSTAQFIGVDPKEWELKYAGKIISGV